MPQYVNEAQRRIMEAETRRYGQMGRPIQTALTPSMGSPMTPPPLPLPMPGLVAPPAGVQMTNMPTGDWMNMVPPIGRGETWMPERKPFDYPRPWLTDNLMTPMNRGPQAPSEADSPRRAFTPEFWQRQARESIDRRELARYDPIRAAMRNAMQEEPYRRLSSRRLGLTRESFAPTKKRLTWSGEGERPAGRQPAGRRRKHGGLREIGHGLESIFKPVGKWFRRHRF